jgi:hypothetical protein
MYAIESTYLVTPVCTAVVILFSGLHFIYTIVYSFYCCDP